MNVNFGLLPRRWPPRRPKAPTARGCAGNEKTVAKKQAMSGGRALADLDRWIVDHLRIAAAA